MDQQYGFELLRENQKLRDEIERLNDWKRIIENAPGQAKDTAIERFNFTQSIMPIIEVWKEKVQTLESELQQCKKALRLAVNDAENEIGCPPTENQACRKWQEDRGACIDCITNYYLTEAKGG